MNRVGPYISHGERGAVGLIRLAVNRVVGLGNPASRARIPRVGRCKRDCYRTLVSRTADLSAAQVGRRYRGDSVVAYRAIGVVSTILALVPPRPNFNGVPALHTAYTVRAVRPQ